MSWIDLHLHSISSTDGSHTPEELMDFCLAAGVRTAAVTDHNSAAAVAAAQQRANVTGTTLISAIELDCTFEGSGLHVLGYWIDPEEPAFIKIERDILDQEKVNSLERVRLIQEYGIFVDEEDVARNIHGGVVTGELLCEVALRDKRNDGNPLLDDYRPGGAFADNAQVRFYWNLCAEGKPAYVDTKFISLDEALSVIHGCGGVAVLAHPGNNIYEDEAKLRAIIKAGVAGLEAFSSYHNPGQIEFYRRKAAELGVCVTAGSDFHGKTKPLVKIGSADSGGMETQILEDLWEARRRRQG